MLLRERAGGLRSRDHAAAHQDLADAPGTRGDANLDDALAPHARALLAHDIDGGARGHQTPLDEIGAKRAAGRSGGRVLGNAGGVRREHAGVDPAGVGVGIGREDEQAEVRPLALRGQQRGHVEPRPIHRVAVPQRDIEEGVPGRAGADWRARDRSDSASPSARAKAARLVSSDPNVASPCRIQRKLGAVGSPSSVTSTGPIPSSRLKRVAFLGGLQVPGRAVTSTGPLSCLCSFN